MPYKTTEAITDPNFLTLGSPGSKWTAESGSGWVVDADGAKNTVPNPAGHVAYHDPSLYQLIADMADPLVAHVKCKLTMVVHSKVGGIGIEMSLIEKENLITHTYEGAKIPLVLSRRLFVALGTTQHYWTGITVMPNGDLYACNSSTSPFLGDIYKRAAGTEVFVSQGLPVRAWRQMAVNPLTGDVYACCISGIVVGDIWKQTGGTGAFVAQGVEDRVWYGITVNPLTGNVYACVYGGDIYMQTGGAGAFVAQSAGIRDWYNMAVNPLTGDVYATVMGGSIYMQTAGAGTFDAIADTSGKNWMGIAGGPDGNVYAAQYMNDVYQRTGGTGSFLNMNQVYRNHFGLAVAPNNDLYASELTAGGDIYILAKVDDLYTYVVEFTPSITKNWALALTGALGFVGAECVIESVSIVQEADPVSVVMSTAEVDPTPNTPIPVTVTFSDSVTGFASGDIVVTNGTVDNFSGVGTTYTFDLVPDAGNPQVVKANIAAGVALSADGIPNDVAPEFSRTYSDYTVAVTIDSLATDPTSTTPIPCTVTFSESVTGFVVGDIVASGGTVSGFSGSGATYTFNLVPDGSNPQVVKANIAAGVAANGDGILNAVAPEFRRTYYVDAGAPPVTWVMEDNSRVVDLDDE